MSVRIRANCFDASALVKVWVDEADCGPARLYFNTQSPTKYTTPFCYFETLSAMKLKWLRGLISREVYLNAAYAMTVWFQANNRKMKDIDFTHPPTFLRAKAIVERYEIDLSDAFQILSIKEGYFSPLANDSKTLLVTADEKLAKAAIAEGLDAWYCLSGPIPE
jgi:predicted nucleic acid-binding protein